MLSSLTFICIWYLIFIIFHRVNLINNNKKENDPITQQLEKKKLKNCKTKV